jgi:hypothetical protein
VGAARLETRLIEDIAAFEPAVLVFEDPQWADGALQTLACSRRSAGER